MKDYSVPLTLIGILSDGEFHSGEQLGDKLGMTRLQLISTSAPYVRWV